jgi:signal transduction histidine kinase/Na+/proline symporter
MIGAEAAALLALGLVLALFCVAAIAERRAAIAARSPLRTAAYTLALGVYCSSWTFYGAVGSVGRDGWNYLPIYAAPVLALLFAPGFFQRLGEAVSAERATTVSDFIAARFGSDIMVARLVTVIALLGSVPYIALQLRSIGIALRIGSGVALEQPVMIAAAALFALFAILYGARRFELAGRSEGLLYAIGLDSLVKLLALLTVTLLAIGVILRQGEQRALAGVARFAALFRAEHLSIDTLVIGLIAALAIIGLPRQFYMGLVEARGPGDLVRARFGFAAYIALMAVLVLPIALAGLTILPSATTPDVYVLALPAAIGSPLVLSIALVGGISAAASMAVVEANALATMVSNDLIFPSMLRRGLPDGAGRIGRRMLAVRRASIAAVMLAALGWGLAISARNSLASIGLIAFAATAQYTPHLILAALRRDNDPLAARASLATGMLLWLYTLALPPVLPQAMLDALDGTLLDPLALLGVQGLSPLVHGVLWSLGGNLLAFAVLAARKMGPPALPRFLRDQRRITTIAELRRLTASFVGEERALAEFAEESDQRIDAKAARRAQELIARVIGASSARVLIASALSGGTMRLDQVTRLLDEGGQSLRFSRALLAATFENMDAGVSVVDADLHLVAWNSRYLELFDYPEGMVRVGAPVADLIRHNARRGDFGPGGADFHVEKRLEHLRRGLEHSFERTRADGRVIKTVGGPMPGGGYVMSFTDVTSEARARAALRETLEALEDRVEARTHELSEANRRLAEADRDKTRFLAAASHDLLQPLHAARLFAAALERDIAPTMRPILARLDGSIRGAEELLRALLDISKLDAGGVQPTLESIALAPLLTELAEELRPMAEAKGLKLRIGPLPGAIHSDSGLVRSVIQNLLVNAVRYTARGGVLIGVRRRGSDWRIDVVDSGVGIPEAQIDTIFGEFTRLGAVDVEGQGLGLALVARIARLLGGTIEVRSVPGRGSRFSLRLPAHAAPAPVATTAAPPASSGRSLRLLVVDDDPAIVEASVTLLRQLGHVPVAAQDSVTALAARGPFDAVIADLRLGEDSLDGLALIAALRETRPGLPAALVTAESGAALTAQAAAANVSLYAKPIDPEALRRFLDRVSVAQVQP